MIAALWAERFDLQKKLELPQVLKALWEQAQEIDLTPALLKVWALSSRLLQETQQDRWISAGA